MNKASGGVGILVELFQIPKDDAVKVLHSICQQCGRPEFDPWVGKSCQILCHPMDYSLPGSSVHEISQARIMEWVTIPFSKDLPNPGIELRSPALQADSLPGEPQGKQYYNAQIMHNI